MNFLGSKSRLFLLVDESFLDLKSWQEYFPSESMNQTVKLVREKLNKVTKFSNSISLFLLFSFSLVVLYQFIAFMIIIIIIFTSLYYTDRIKFGAWGIGVFQEGACRQ